MACTAWNSILANQKCGTAVMYVPHLAVVRNC